MTVPGPPSHPGPPSPPGPQQWAHVVPYVEHHTGPRRVLTVRLEATTGLLGGVTTSMIKPNVFIDGRQYIVYWGDVAFEIPADRAVHLAIGMQDGLRGASALIPPGEQHLAYGYSIAAMGEPQFGPVGPA